MSLNSGSLDIGVTGNILLKGNYNASTNSPDLDCSPTACSIKKGDQYVISVSGTFFTEAIQAGDSIIAQQDNPNTLSHWITVENNLSADPFCRANHSGTQAQSTVTCLSTDLAARSPLASPTFTGTVAIPNYADVESTLDGIATNATAVALKSPLASPTFTGTTTTSLLDVAGNNIDNIQNLIHDTSTTTTALDFDGDQLQTISISAATTFTTSNRAIGKSKTIKITTDGTLRTLTFPAWKFVGAKPADQAASKIGILTITSFGTADTDIVAAYAVEE
jgi:hypothetical protein